MIHKLKLNDENIECKFSSIICSEDKYYWSGKQEGIGEYKFDETSVVRFRDLYNNEIKNSIDNGVNLIILDNCNVRVNMYEKHIKYGVNNGYKFDIIEFIGNKELIDKYYLRSCKSFSKQMYLRLLNNWENDPRAKLIYPTFIDQTNLQIKNDSKKVK